MKTLLRPFIIVFSLTLACFDAAHGGSAPPVTAMLYGATGPASPRPWPGSIVTNNPVPVVTITGGQFTLTGDMLHAEIQVKGSDAPTSASLHGPAYNNSTAPLMFSFSSPVGEPQTGYSFAGDFILSARQSEGLLAGQWYVNITSRTATNGNIRFKIFPDGPSEVKFTAQLTDTNATPPSPDPASATGFFVLQKQRIYGYSTDQIVLTCGIQYEGYPDLPFSPAFIQGPVNGTNQTIFTLDGPPHLPHPISPPVLPPPPFQPPPFPIPPPTIPTIPTFNRSVIVYPTFYFGSFVLNDQQEEDLLNGRWSVVFDIGVNGSPTNQYTILGQILPVDSDNDGVPDYRDFYPNTPAGEPVNSLGGSIDQICPCDANWKIHAEYVTRMENTILEFENDGLITAVQGRAILQQARHSDCGERSLGWLFPNRN